MEQFPTPETQENSQVKVIKAAFDQHNAEIAPLVAEIGEENLTPEVVELMTHIRTLETRLESKQAA